MELYGEIVRHIAFGRGQIVGFDNHYVTVLFDEIKTEKKFAYPAVFGSYLELENNSFLKQIEEDKNVIAAKEAELKRLKEERVQAEIDAKAHDDRGKNTTGTAGKSPDKNNIAFKCNYCDGGESKEVVGYRGVCSDETIKFNIKTAKHIWCSQPDTMCCQYLNGEISRAELCEFYERTKSEFSESVCYESQMLEIWTAGAGITQKGYKKGKPMTLRNVKANSLSLLTSKLPYAEDKDRFIFAVFLINENYEGDTRETGHVGANSKYRIQLSLDEARELKFWDYYFNENKPEKIIFGSGLHRYMTDIQAAQVLKKICEIKKGTAEETLSKEFLEYYCRIKKVDIDSLPIPNGALQRMMRLCPACGSTDTVEILYAMPTPESSEAAERGKGVLGGGCISDINPTRHCKACGKDFGGGNRFSLVDMISFEFSIGGFSGTSDSIYIDAKQKNKVVRYATTPGGLHVDLKQPKNELNLNPHMVFKEIPLTSKKWLAFIEELTSLEIACWKDRYYDNDICDGTQWKIVIRLPDSNKISKCGSNEYPPGWNKFIKIIKKYIDKNID